MKILIVSYWTVPNSGGVSTYVLALKEGLEIHGHEVDVFAHDKNATHYYLMNSNRVVEKAAIYQMVKERSSLKKKVDAAVDPWISHMEEEIDCLQEALTYFGLDGYDLIHTQDIISTLAVFRSKPLNMPLITTIHGNLSYEWYIQGIIKPGTTAWHWAISLDNYGSRLSDVTIVPSHWLKSVYVNNFRVTSEQFRVIPYGIKHNPIERQVRSMDKTILLCPARFDPVKGHYILLQALSKLLLKRRDWMCWLAGEGALKDDLQRQIETLGLKNHVFFIGHRNDMPTIFGRSDIVVIPSLHDNLPYSIIEAQLAGKPVVASNAGGIPEMIEHGRTGLLFPVGQASEMCDQLDTLLSNVSSQLSIGHNAQHWGQTHWNLNRMIKHVIHEYNSVSSLKGAGGGK
ncbi:glycosyltransferase family 4 protein [Paenibacillus sp. RC67]|uniref:glycosyltransferase family 4 protein n=1 Tax=Paenibacillus sp. RC67 TaxID=3039392 RepID=UPI0024ADC30F|nr:glycosyltransferase family 4 protein [Paenibacillus sp. RC67]